MNPPPRFSAKKKDSKILDDAKLVKYIRKTCLCVPIAAINGSHNMRGLLRRRPCRNYAAATPVVIKRLSDRPLTSHVSRVTAIVHLKAIRSIH